MKIPVKQYLQLLTKYLKSQWRMTLLLVLLLFSSIGLQLINPQIIRRFIDGATQKLPEQFLFQTALLFVGVALLQQVLNVLATYTSENVGWTATNALRNDLARHCMNLDLSFHNAHTPGEMIERLDGDVTTLSNFFSQFIIQIAGSVLLLIGVLGVLFREDWRVGAGLTSFTLVTAFVLYRLQNIAMPYWESERQSSADLFGFLEERIAGTEDIRSNGAKTYVMNRFFTFIQALMKRTIKAGLMINILVNAIEILFTLGMVIAFLIGAYLFRASIVSIGTVYIIFQYSMMLMGPIMRLTQQVQDLQRSGASITRVQGLFAIQSKIVDQNENAIDGSTPGSPAVRQSEERQLPSGPLAVRFREVSFSYKDEATPSVTDLSTPKKAGETQDGAQSDVEKVPDKTVSPKPEDSDASGSANNPLVLKDISFHLQPGTVLGLLGRTGSGKTSLTRLLFRLYDPDHGDVSLGNDGHLFDLRQVAVKNLRQRVGMVTQNIQLFHASVRDNLTFFDPSIPDDRILKVFKDLGLWKWYQSLPSGLDTELEAAGGGLSAGEAQLLAFSRIFLRDPGLVILDEASSRLDPATEQMIERAVDTLVQNRTAIIIAHRLHTVQRADEILILEDGHVIEYGKRTALAADHGSRFASLLKTGLEEVLV